MELNEKLSDYVGCKKNLLEPALWWIEQYEMSIRTGDHPSEIQVTEVGGQGYPS
jgi:hypothetical protein